MQCHFAIPNHHTGNFEGDCIIPKWLRRRPWWSPPSALEVPDRQFYWRWRCFSFGILRWASIFDSGGQNSANYMSTLFWCQSHCSDKEKWWDPPHCCQPHPQKTCGKMCLPSCFGVHPSIAVPTSIGFWCPRRSRCSCPCCLHLSFVNA